MDYQITVPKRSGFLVGALFLFGLFFSWAQTAQQTADVTATYNFAKLIQLQQRFENEAKSTEQKISKLIPSKELARTQIGADGTKSYLYGVGEDGSLLYYQAQMSPSAKVTRADALHNKGLLDLGVAGDGMKVGVWDAGKALTSHQEFSNRVTNSDKEAEVDSHATLVTGVIAASGIEKEAKGIAYGAQVISNDWRFDRKEVVEETMNGMLVSNHSYGIKTSSVPDWYFGAYIQLSKNWDEIMYNAPYYLMVSAAGNAQRSQDNQAPIFGKSADGFDLLLGFNTAKNGMVVTGANTSIDENGQLKNADLTAYSSFGPVDDGRIKPDLAGDGTSIYSTAASHNKSYGSSMGTSMAAPGVSASLILLQEYYQRSTGTFMKAATLKGLALHTADDVFEPGPDYKLGWGIMNTKAAAEFIQAKDYQTLLMENTLPSSGSYTFEVTANEGENLMVSLSWTDPEADQTNTGELNSTLAALVNDLDVRVTQNGQTFFPWKLNPAQAHKAATLGDNKVDPFERIDIPNAKGTYTITITHKGTLKFDQQDFSLLVSGIQMGTCSLVVPEGLTISSKENTSQLSWNQQGETLYEVQLKKADEAEWTTHWSWEGAFELQGLELGETYITRVRSVCTESLASDFSAELRFVFQGEDTTLVVEKQTEIKEKLSLRLYPNPVVNEVSVGNEVSANAQYYVTDMAGFVVKQGALKETIAVADLPSGMYVLKVYDLEGTSSGKFLKK